MTGSKNFIPFNGLDRQYRNHKEELLASVDEVLSTGKVLGGQQTTNFEQAIAKRTGRKYVVSLNSCTSAIHAIMAYIRTARASAEELRIGIPNFSFSATKTTMIDRGRIYDLDVNPDTGILVPSEIAANAMPLDVLMYVNLYGNMIDSHELTTVLSLFTNNKDTVVIEDAAQSFGASRHGRPSGSFGDFSVLSFDPTKNLPNSGSGGMVLTDNFEAAEWIRTYRANFRSVWADLGGSIMASAVNNQMSELDAAGLLVKLNYFDLWQERRAQIADFYHDHLDDAFHKPHDYIDGDTVHAWHKYVVQHKKRDAIKIAMWDAGIDTKIHYANTLGGGIGASAIARSCLSLPIFPEMTDNEVERVVTVMNRSI